MSLQVGDFIAIATVAARAFQALNSTRGSKAEFTSLLGTFKSITQAMLQAEALCIGCHVSFAESAKPDPARVQLINSVAEEITKEKNACEDLLNQFLKSFAAYTDAFMEPGRGVFRQTYRKLSWMGRKDEAANLEKRLTTHLQNLQLRIYAYCYASMKSELVDSSTLLGSLDSSVSSLTDKFSDMQLTINEAFHKLESIQGTIPASLGYSWGSEAPLLLLDGLGRKTPLPMMLVQTPASFRDVLLIMHRGGLGYDKIENGEYVISDEDFGGALIPYDKWSSSFHPGRHIGLSFLLKHSGSGDEKECPRCKTLKTWLDDQPGRRRCLKCHLTYQIEEKERTRRFWKDLKPRPEPKPRTQSSPKEKIMPQIDPVAKPVRRTQTLPPTEFAHQYQRVHYERDVSRRGSKVKQWQKSDPEFEDFLVALPPVHRAAATGDVDKLDKLLDNGENEGMNWTVPSHSLFRHDRTGWDFTGAPPIHFAAYYGHKYVVLYLLSCGADIDARDAAGTTALHAAAWTGNEDLFQRLLEKHANPKICDYDGWSVAIYAMNQAHDSISRLLLKNSSGEEELLVKTYTLRHAAKLGNADTVLGMLLEEQVARRNSKHRQLFLSEALVGAAEGGHVDLVQKLLEVGADPSSADNTGSTALHWCGWGGHTEIGNLLHDSKGEVDCEDDRDENRDEAASARLRLRSTDHESVVQMLLHAGADINAQNSQGCTPLHWVAGAGSAPMIQCFLDHGGNPDIVDSTGRTATDRAVETGDDKVISQLQSR